MLFSKILKMSAEMSKEDFELMLKVADEDINCYTAMKQEYNEHKIIKLLEQSKRVVEAC